MRKSRLPVELVNAILRVVAFLDVESLRRTFAALDTFDPELIRALLHVNKEKATHDILETGDLQCIRCAIEHGARLDKHHYARLLDPYRSDILRVVWQRGYSCLTKRAKISWWDFAERMQSEDHMLDLLSFHKKLRGAPITRDAAKRLLDRGFTRVIQHLLSDHYNVPWLRYFAILHPEQCPGAEPPWELFQKIFLQTNYLKGYRLENHSSQDVTDALRVVLSRLSTLDALRACETRLGSLAFSADAEKVLRDAKIRLGLPVTQLRLPKTLTLSLTNQTADELLYEAVKARVFHRVESGALSKLVAMGRWSAVRNLLFHVCGVWDMLLDLMCGDDLPSAKAVAREILPVAGPHRSVTLRQATVLLRRGQWDYLASHDVWGRSMTLTYVAVGLGLQEFVGLMLTRMAGSRTFGDTAPFHVGEAIELARQRGQPKMAAYISERCAP